MSNVVQLPQMPRVRVSHGVDVTNGLRTYVFELVEAGMRNVIATYTDIKRVAVEAAYLMEQDYEVVWDDPELIVVSGTACVIPIAGQ